VEDTADVPESGPIAPDFTIETIAAVLDLPLFASRL